MTVLPAELQQDHKAVGAKVRVLTTGQETFEGVIFTLDLVAHFLLLEEQDGAKTKTRIFQLEALQKVEVLEPAPAGLMLTLPVVSDEELQRVEQRNKGLAERALASIGQGVSVEAQSVFDALNKTMPCEWEGANIRVMAEVVIKPPYQQQNCVSANTQVLSRVKKVLEGEKSKLKKVKK
ncbi:protein with role in RNA processing [Phytophthora pseudosyringae]|uniref:Protein with role in RNA processing n=1 Tax=Phytophthora pseudosyringae TaxID=221518 RepID=A0A8T1VC35_9STRA|nr:protein with role in RNA processing [Phytophthora pseudosyringae]